MTQLAPPPSPTTAAPAGPPPAPEHRRLPRRALWLSVAAVAVLVLAALLSVSIGTLRLDPLAAVRAVVAPDAGQVSTVVWSLRLPRVVVAMLVGAALAGVGVVMQAVFRNPLADPGVTGVSSGAAVGAVAGITLGASLQWGVPLAAFAGSLTVALVLQAVLQANRGASTYTLILVGVSINAFAGAIISMLVANAHDD